MRWIKHLGLLKAHSAEALHDRVSQRAQLVTLSIVLPVFHEGIAMQQLEEHFAHVPVTTAIVPAFGSNPHPRV